MLGTQEILFIVVVALLLFGAAKIPELARSLGKSIGEFKKAQRESESELKELEEERSVELSKTQKTALNMGISIEGKSDEELLDEIEEKSAEESS